MQEQQTPEILISEMAIAFRPELSRILGGIEVAIIYQQLCHWSRYARREDGFIYKTAIEFEQETTVTERQLRRARQILIDKRIIEAEKKMANGSPTWHYRVLVFPTTVLRVEPVETPVPTIQNASSITKTTHENKKYTKEIEESIAKLYKGWLIEFVVGAEDWAYTNDSAERASILAAAGKQIRLTPKRRQKMAARLSDTDFATCAKAIKNCAASEFHRGHNDRHWKATIEWLFNSVERTEEWANK